MAALKQLAVPVVRVRRGGTLLEMSARELVPGDVVLLEAGNAVPADVRLLESASLRIQEAALTGESEAVEKTVEAIPEAALPVGDRRNMAYLGTSVTYGRGSAVVVATGMKTELGKIAGLIQDVAPEKTPLQQRLDRIGKALAAAGGIAALPGAAGRLVVRRAPGRHVPHGGQRGRGGGARGAAGGRHHHPRPRGPAHAAAQRPDPQTAGRGDPRGGHRDLLGQDGHPHREPHDGDGDRRGRRAR